MNIIPISILNDNYVWIIKNNKKKCIIIDPGLADPVIKIINKLKLTPIAILITHDHCDHIGGIKKLLNIYPKLHIYSSTLSTKFKVTHLVEDNDIISLLNYKFKVLLTPGHTKNHISYYMSPHLFCGDTLFSGGCGRIKVGLLLSMYFSLRKILKLPNNTLIYSAHEYTQSNLRFSNYLLPNNKNIKIYYDKIKLIRKKNLCTLPSRLNIEKKINPFLMLNNRDLKNNLKINNKVNKLSDVLLVLRTLKDKFK